MIGEIAFDECILDIGSFIGKIVCRFQDIGQRMAVMPGAGFMDYFFKNGLEKLQALYQRGKEKGVQDPESYAVKNWIIRIQGFLIGCVTFGFTSNYTAIMNGTYPYDLYHGTYGEKLMHLLGDMAFRRVFSSDTIYKMEMTESVMLDFLMNRFVHAALYYDTSKQLSSIDSRYISLISDNYKNAYKFHAAGKSEEEKLYLRLLLVTDYICGMTDSYAKRLYQELTGII